MHHGAGIGVLPFYRSISGGGAGGICVCVAAGDGRRMDCAVHPTSAAEGGAAGGRADVEDGEGEEALDPRLGAEEWRGERWKQRNDVFSSRYEFVTRSIDFICFFFGFEERRRERRKRMERVSVR